MKPMIWILHILTALIAGTLLELNHSRWIGWILFLAVVILFPLVAKRMPNGSYAALFWLGSLAVYAGIFFLAWPQVKPVPATSAAHPDVTDVITTDSGKITGVFNQDHTVEVYAGIPYAAPPIGQLRWKKPQHS